MGDSDGSEQLSPDDIEALLNQASSSIDQAAGVAEPPPQNEPEKFNLAELGSGEEFEDSADVSVLGEVELDLRVELGRTQMKLEEVLRLRSGSVVALDKLAGDPVDVFVNGRLIARGEVLVMNDNFCIRVTELVEAVA